VGIVTINGLKTSAGGKEPTIKRIVTSTSIDYKGTDLKDLEYPPFAEGDEISLSAEGGKFADPFSIAAKGISLFR
jgi:hypothetical protein